MATMANKKGGVQASGGSRMPIIAYKKQWGVRGSQGWRDSPWLDLQSLSTMKHGGGASRNGGAKSGATHCVCGPCPILGPHPICSPCHACLPGCCHARLPGHCHAHLPWPLLHSSSWPLLHLSSWPLLCLPSWPLLCWLCLPLSCLPLLCLSLSCSPLLHSSS